MLVVDDDPRRRLLVVAALASRFDVIPLPSGEDPLRAARARRPELVLFALTRARSDETLRYVRTLRTDVRPIEHVGVYAEGAPPRPAPVVMETWRSGGYLAGDLDPTTLLGFAERVLSGDDPVRVPDPPASRFGRLVERLRTR